MVHERSIKVSLIDIMQARMEVLIERFGGKTTLNQVHLAMYAHGRLLTNQDLTVSEAARFSGLPKSTIQGWVDARDYISFVPDPYDDRKRLFRMDDIDRRTDYMLELLEIVWDADRWLSEKDGPTLRGH